MSEFRKDGGGDFDKSSVARTGSSTAGGSGLDPFGFRASVQASLAAEHKPSADVVDLIQRWRIVEQVTRAVQRHMNERLGDHRDLRHLSPTYTLEPGNGRSLLRSTEPPPALDVLISFSLEDLPKRGYPLVVHSDGATPAMLNEVPTDDALWPLLRRELEHDGWFVVGVRYLGQDQDATISELRASLAESEGLHLAFGEPSLTPTTCPDCGRPLSTVSFNRSAYGVQVVDEHGTIVPPSRLQTRAVGHLVMAWPEPGQDEWAQTILSGRGEIAFSSEAWERGIDVPAEHLGLSSAHVHIGNEVKTLKFRLMPSYSGPVDLNACMACSLIVPDHVKQVSTLRLTVPDHVLRRWLV